MTKVSKDNKFPQKVSVAMATYNGQKYIKEQIDSILNNLRKNDELVISDDGSTDNTIAIIKAYKDHRIKLINGPRSGFKNNFCNCIQNCNGEIIFLADQDDIWDAHKVDTILNEFCRNPDCTCIVHDAEVVAADGRTVMQTSFLNKRVLPCPGIFSNILQSKYYGCMMAFKKRLLEKALPIPESIVSHDYWIGLISDKYGKTRFIKDKLIKYRRHNNNTSNWQKHMSFNKMIQKRVNIYKELFKR